MSVDGRGRRLSWRLVLGGLVLLVVGAACAWATMTVLRPADDPLASTEHTYVEVTRGKVGASISLNTIAEWSQVPAGSNHASGIVTSIGIEPGAEVSHGSVLYSVDLRPVAVAQGEVPMFRQIGAGVAGADVRQLQEMLAALGYYDSAFDGRAEAGTIAAIKRWQKSSGLSESGVVEQGDLIFVSRLPARLALNSESIHRGASLSGGEEAVLGLPAAPRFWVPVSEGQAAMITAGTVIEVTSPDGQTWRGVAGEQERDADGGAISIAVTGPDGTVLCGDACGQVPVSGQTTLLSNVVTVEQVEGLLVPSSALVTMADAGTAVIGEDGKRIPVEVLTSAKGMSVVSGVDEGTRVRVPAKDESGE
jgi:hypothetical protein